MAGVSTSTITVRPGRTAAATASASVPSTNVTSMPKRGHTVVKSWLVTENVLRWATTWSPCEHRPRTTDEMAPMPEPKASAASAPSSRATASSNWATVGLPLRA